MHAAKIEDNVLIGMGATVLDGSVVSDVEAFAFVCRTCVKMKADVLIWMGATVLNGSVVSSSWL